MATWLSDALVDRLREAVGGTCPPEIPGGRYRLGEVLDRGGMGVVYRADDRELDREVAIKVLDARRCSPETQARMLREARVLASLEHPGIVPVHDVGTTGDGRVFYAMQLVRGRRLDAVAREGLPAAERLRLLVRVCETVAYAHDRGIVHRDLKPPNIMVGAFGEVKVMDWGLAKRVDVAPEPDPEAETVDLPAAPREGEPPETETGAVLGTPGYMAPEQMRGEVARLGTWTDVFALGALLRFLWAPEPMPRPLAAIAARAQAESPEDRYADAGRLAVELSRFLDRLPVEAYRENLWERTARWAARYKLPLALVLAYLLMRAALLWLFQR